MKKLYKIEVDECGVCPSCNAYSVDCVAHAYCNKAHKPLPADHQDGTEIMYMEIPAWCPLPDLEGGA